MVPLQTNNHKEKGWQWLPDSPLLYLDAEKERDRRQERSDSYTHCSPHLQTRGAAKIRERIMTIFPKRLQQEMFQEKKDKNFSMQVWTMWKPTGPLTVSPGRGPPESQWQFLRRNTPMDDWTSGCLGLSFNWNPKREGITITEANELVHSPKRVGNVLFLSGKAPKRVVLTWDTSGPFWFRNNTEELTDLGTKLWPQDSQGLLASGTCILRSAKYTFIFQPQGNNTQVE